MKLFSKKIITSLVIVLTTLSQSIACTSVTLVNKNGDTVSGRTMEWGLNWDWQLIYMPKGTTHNLTAPSNLNLPKQEYTSKYSVLGTGLIKDNHEFLLDGQNNQGLSLSANYLPDFTKYQTVTTSDNKYASIAEIATYILSDAQTVQQAKGILKEYKVWSDKDTMVNGIDPQLHFLITDKTGQGLVVEYIKGKVKFYDVNTRVKVMTNSPTYDWHLTNIRNYLNLSNKTKALIKLGDDSDNKVKDKDIQDINALGQGNGFLGLPGDYSPPSRFIKTAVLSYYANIKGDKNESLVSKVTHILNTVDIAKGTVVEKMNNKAMYDHTAFTVAKDLNNNKLYITTYNHPNNPVMIDLNTLDSSNTKAFAKVLEKLPFPNNDITSELAK